MKEPSGNSIVPKNSVTFNLLPSHKLKYNIEECDFQRHNEHFEPWPWKHSKFQGQIFDQLAELSAR